MTVAAQASATLPATAVTHPIAHTMAARKVARKRPAARQCELCGGNHTLSQCRLPGAVKYRCLSMKAMKQSAFKPPRFGSQRSKGAYRINMRKAYSGAHSLLQCKKTDKMRKNPVKMRTPLKVPLVKPCHALAEESMTALVPW